MIIMIVMIVILAMATEMAGVVSVQIGGSRRYDGPMGKSDRAFAFGVIAILLGIQIPVENWIPWILGIILFLLFITLRNRIRMAL